MPDGERLSDWANCLAAAQCAASAAGEILRCVRENDMVSLDVLVELVDAAKLIAELQPDDDTGQLVAACVKWLEEHA